MNKMFHAGFGHYMATEKIVAIATPTSAPIKRSIQEARDNLNIVDLTNGRKTKAVIFTTSHQVVLSALEPVTISGRIDSSLNARPESIE